MSGWQKLKVKYFPGTDGVNIPIKGGGLVQDAPFENQIELEYELLKVRMVGGSYRGMSIDMNNPKMVAVAAYHMAKLEDIRENLRRHQELMSGGIA